MKNEPVPPSLMAPPEHGQHIGEWPTCEKLRASIRQRNAEGYPTVLASTYARQLGGEPCEAVEELCDLA